MGQSGIQSKRRDRCLPSMKSVIMVYREKGKARKYPVDCQESSLFLLEDSSLLLSLKIKGVGEKGRHQVVENHVASQNFVRSPSSRWVWLPSKKEGNKAKPCSIQTLLLGSFAIASLTQKSARLSASCLNGSI